MPKLGSWGSLLLSMFLITTAVAPSFARQLREMFIKVTKGALSGTTGGPTIEEFKINGQYVNTPDQKLVGIPFLDEYIENASVDYLDKAARAGKPFFMSINFMKVHQPNMPAPEFEGKSIFKSKYADSLVDLRAILS
jgi:hypothetical protein